MIVADSDQSVSNFVESDGSTCYRVEECIIISLISEKLTQNPVR